ncbi:hypothetical protein [Streptomyces sp. NPDC056987]|uniref:hypothetical protein n=1 Tax=Streptomyces sp. NPDC056987 TaxID=3345988 RepID=UPI003640A0FC
MPLRLVVGGQYSDAALPVYIKIAALSMRPQGCRAKVITIAQYLGMSKSAVERGLRQLHHPDPVDGITEVITVHHTSRDGDGESAERRVRAVDTDGPELYVWIPVRAADALTPRELRLYAAIAYAQVRRIPLALADLADHVRHQGGQHAGEPLGERQVMRIVDELEASGWISVHRRQGPRGRHIYEAHRHPLHMIATGQAPQGPGPATPDIHDGSAPRRADGSPCVEDPRTDRPDENDTELGGPVRRRRGDRKWVARPVENPPAIPAALRAGHGEKRSNSGGQPYDGPDLTISGRVWKVLGPLRHVYWQLTVWEQREIARQIGSQLSAGCPRDRLKYRVGNRYAAAQDPYRGEGGIGRWILGVALPRAPKGCGIAACEDKAIWPTLAPCPGCEEIARDKAAAAARIRQAEAERAARAQRRRAEEQWAERTAAWARRQEEEAAAAAQAGESGAQQPAGPDVAQSVPPGPRSGAEPGPDPGVEVAVWPRRAPATPPPHQDLDAAELAVLRAAATPEAITAAVAEHGRTHAVYLYGHALVLRHLNVLDSYGLEGEARAQ